MNSNDPRNPTNTPGKAHEKIVSHVLSTFTETFGLSRTVAILAVLFIVGADPVRLGLVRSFARPGGNLTGVNIITTELTAKRLELVRALMPKAMRVGLLVDPTNVVNTETAVRDAEDAARSMGLKIRVLNAQHAPRH